MKPSEVIWRNLEAALVRRGISKSEAAAVMGITDRTARTRRKDTRTLTGGNIDDICKAYKIPLRELTRDV